MLRMDQRRYAALPIAEQRKRMLDELSPAVEGIDLLRNRILVCTFQESEKTAGGIYKPDKKLDEGQYQGTVGLVLKLGPLAFEFDEIVNEVERFARDHGDCDGEDLLDIRRRHNVPAVGDWIMFREADTWPCSVALVDYPGQGVHCRVLLDDSVVGVIANPSHTY